MLAERKKIIYDICVKYGNYQGAQIVFNGP